MTASHPWWKTSVFYQIYPRSFADANGDGIGDFRGMTSKLDYLKDLGIGALWLSPHFPSPNKDFGYDITDYEGVHPEYGTLADFDEFLAQAHRRGIRVVLDLVLNHTSDQHPWFLESQTSRTNPKADWYVWSDSRPNNWQSIFDGDAWTFSPERGQWYYHFFMKEQPDLNWRNPEVKAAMWKAVRFWLDRGVDGFRLDAIGAIFENPRLTDHRAGMSLMDLKLHGKPSDWKAMFREQSHQPGLHELMKDLRRLIDEYPGDRVLIGEESDTSYHGNGHDELHLTFNFPLMHAAPFTPAKIRRNQRDRLGQLAQISPDCWPCNTLGNHDVGRIWDRAGSTADAYRLHLVAVALLKGTPVLYYGDEIGMADHLFWGEGEILDTMATWYAQALEEHEQVPSEEARRRAAVYGRDKLRTPMQWDPQGWNTPWLPHHPNRHQGVTVADQQGKAESLLEFTRTLLTLRQSYPALVVGEQELLETTSRSLLPFRRFTRTQSVLVVLNFGAQDRTFFRGPQQIRVGGRNYAVVEERR